MECKQFNKGIKIGCETVKLMTNSFDSIDIVMREMHKFFWIVCL